MITALKTHLQQHRAFRHAALLLTCLGLALTTTAVAQEALSLNDVSVASLPGDQVEVRLEFSQPPSGDPLSFTIDNRPGLPWISPAPS